MASPKKKALPQSVINYYSKYKNPSTNIKSQVIMGTKFEVDDRYELIDTSNFTLKYKKKQIFFKKISWARRLWRGCRCKR